MESEVYSRQEAPSGGNVTVPCGLHQLMRVNKVRLRLLHVQQSLRSRGVVETLRKVAEKLGVSPARKGQPAPRREDEVLGLMPGEWVVVKSADEIRATLNRHDMNRGLYFMPEMWKYCDQEFLVLKRMNRLRVESTGEVRQIKNTVLLDGTICDGSSQGGCDASCHHLWREVWLRRVDAPATVGGSEGD